jgi:hypothetical protein
VPENLLLVEEDSLLRLDPSEVEWQREREREQGQQNRGRETGNGGRVLVLKNRQPAQTRPVGVIFAGEFGDSSLDRTGLL